LPERLKAAVLAAVTDEAGGEWFAAVWPQGGQEGEVEQGAFYAAFAAARRRLGGARVRWAGKDWRCDELGRAALILRAFELLPGDAHAAFLVDLYAKGENREKAAILRALPLLPRGARFIELALEAGRANALDVFEAIACENPWPAAHFPAPAFERLIVKALFLGVALSRIEGLEGRITPELRRMAGDFARERRAAGRPVPADVGRILKSREAAR
jgi:hypothetical protein